MQEVQLSDVFQRIEAALEKQDYKEAGKWLWPALDQFDDHPQLLFYSSHMYVQDEKYTAAYLVCKKSMDLTPNGNTAANLGAICRRLNKKEEALKWLNAAVEYDSDNKHAWNNLAATFVNEGNPWPGIEAAKKALAIDPKFNKARWNMGLMKLEAGDYETGWDDYREGLVSGERWLRVYGPDATSPPVMLESRSELRRFEQQQKRKPRVVVWGEQGIGDEIMFSTILRDLAKEAEIIFDCHPRLIGIMQDSYGDVIKEFYPTRKQEKTPWYKDAVPIDFKCSTGDLGRFYRRSRTAFQATTPFIKADEGLTERYSTSLDEIARLQGKPDALKVGFAYTGGIIKTMRWYRSIDPMQLAPVLNHPNVMPISLQYEDEAATIQAFTDKFGKAYLSFPAVTHAFAYEHTAALVASLDVVITVCQSVAHLSAAMGKETYVLVPERCAWRYGPPDGTEEWFFYPFASVHLIRGLDAENGWDRPLARVAELFKENFGI